MSLHLISDYFSNEKNLDKIILIQEGKPYTKKDFTLLIQKFRDLASREKSPEIALYAMDNLLFMAAYLGILYAGKTVILLSNPLQETLLKLGISAFFTDTNVSFPHVLLTADTYTENVPLKPFDPDLSKVVFFTSGSTSDPKRIEKTFRLLYLESLAVDKILAPFIKDGVHMVTTVNMFHLYGMTFAFLYAMAKGVIIDAKRIDTPEGLSEKLSLYKDSFFISSPAFLDRLSHYQDLYTFENAPALIMSSGGPLSKAGADAAQLLFSCDPIEIFGSTETGAVAFRQQNIDPLWQLLPDVSGKPDDQGQLVALADFIGADPMTLSDSVTFSDATHFTLNGRLDRMVKIEEKRVSLPAVEAALSEHPFIHKVYATVLTGRSDRKSIGAMAVLSKDGQKELVAVGKKSLTGVLTAYAKTKMEKVAVPSKWRFVSDFPLSRQSKMLKDEILSLFYSKIEEPVVLSKTPHENGIRLKLIFLSGSTYFQGHFPEFALLPAVVQIHFALYFSHRLFYTPLVFSKMLRLKFSDMIRPGKTVYLTLTPKNDTLSFSYTDEEGKPYASGSFSFDEGDLHV